MTLTEKQQRRIVNLYKKRKLSAKQISEKIEVSFSSVKYCLKKNNIKKRSISEAIRNLHITKFNKKPFKIKNNLSKKEKKLKIAGVMLYWGEGTKDGNVVKLDNSDPEMISLFIRFLNKICGIYKPRLKALLHKYPDQSEKELKKIWKKITNIPEKNFYKTYEHKGKKGTYKKRSKYGTLTIYYSDKRLLSIIKKWICEYKNELI